MSAEPHHVLLTADAVGGVWTYTLELAAALAARSVKVELAVLGPAPTAGQRDAAARAGANLRETGLPLDWTAEPTAVVQIAAQLAALARDLRVDLAQLHGPALLGDAVWTVPVLAVVHSCVGTWWRGVRGDEPPPADFAWRMAGVARGLAAADAVVAPSHAMAAALGRVYGTPRPVAVVWNGAAPRAVAPAGARHGVLIAGRLWDEGKNIAMLDEAARLMPTPVRAAGSTHGPNGASLKLQAIEQLGVLDRDGMDQALAEARVFAAPALYEPFGLAVLEAAQAGLPLVLADIPTFRELWDGAAIFLPPRDAGAWARALAALHEEPAACQRIAGLARRRAEDYNTARFAAAMWRQFETLMRGRGALNTPGHATAAA